MSRRRASRIVDRDTGRPRHVKGRWLSGRTLTGEEGINVRTQRVFLAAGRVAGAVLVALAVGCSRSESQPQATATHGSVDTSASATGEPATVGKACRKRERSTVSRVEWPLMQAAWRVESGLPGRNNLSAPALDHRVDRLWQRLTAGCPTPSKEARAFAAEVHKRVGEALSGRGLDAVLASYRDWATLVGLQHMGGALLKDRASCRQLIPNVPARYAVWWQPTAQGKDYWVQLIMQNDTDELLRGSLEGSLWATDPLPGSFGVRTMHRGRHSQRFDWGGSSADFMYARPHSRSTTFVGV